MYAHFLCNRTNAVALQKLSSNVIDLIFIEQDKVVRPTVLGESSHQIRASPKNHRRCIMSTYAIIKTGGKQVKVEVGQAIYVEKINAEAGSEVTFNEVVLVGGDKTVVGTPVVEGATVVGTIEKQGKQKKVVTFKYKPKKGSHRKQGHRQPYTKVVINAINA